MDGVFDIGLSSVLDTVSTANELAGTLKSPVPPIDITMVGVRSPLAGRRSSTGSLPGLVIRTA
jgi:hypothetical protein